MSPDACPEKDLQALKAENRAEVLSMIKSILVFIGFFALLHGSVVQAFKIPSGSMEPTLIIDDYLLVNKLSYGLRLVFVPETLALYNSPDREDIVVFTRPHDDPETPDFDEREKNIIKRVIGLPGETIEVRGTRVYINGKRYIEDERYARWLLGGKENFGPKKVPDGHVFVMGDNRDHSRDSRFWKREMTAEEKRKWPNISPPWVSDNFLPFKRIKGRAFIIYWNSSFNLSRIFNIIR